MKPFQSLTIPEQLALHLRQEIEEGRLRGMMPGVLQLEKQAGVNRKTVETALRLLEQVGLLEPQGIGKRRRIVAGGPGRPSLRIALLFSDPSDGKLDYIVDLRHSLAEAGHTVIPTRRCMMELGMDPSRIGAMVDATAVEAWVVVGGSREILEWFIARQKPVFAMFGTLRGLPLSGAKPDKVKTYREVTRRLVELGHRRIVLLARTRRRQPEPGAVERAYLAELAAHGIDAGAYHLPHWEDSVDGFLERLERLFRITPPTALIIQESPLFVAALHFLARRGIRVPDDVSLVCTDGSPEFSWCRPSVSHIRWDSGPVVRRIVRWAGNVSRGRKDLRQTLTPAEFVPGGTIGPAA